LTRFRYDVVLHVAESAPQQLDCKWMDWGRESLSTDSIRERLGVNHPEALGISGVPNARISRDVAALAALRHDPGPSSVAELREFLDAERRTSRNSLSSATELGQIGRAHV